MLWFGKGRVLGFCFRIRAYDVLVWSLVFTNIPRLRKLHSDHPNMKINFDIILLHCCEFKENFPPFRFIFIGHGPRSFQMLCGLLSYRDIRESKDLRRFYCQLPGCHDYMVQVDGVGRCSVRPVRRIRVVLEKDEPTAASFSHLLSLKRRRFSKIITFYFSTTTM